MKTLTIKDLASNEALGRKEMAAVRGGYSLGACPTWPVMSYSPSVDSSVHATQNLAQGQQVLNETADGSAFLGNIHVKNTTNQFGQNNILVG